MWRTLKQDTVAKVAAMVVAFLVFPYVFPVLSPAQLQTFADRYQFFILISLTILALRFPVGQAERVWERRFWNYLAVAFTFLLVSEAYYQGLRGIWGTVDRRVVLDSLYLAFYLTIVLAAETKPHLKSGQTSSDAARTLELGGLLVFVFGLSVYFILIPSAVNRTLYFTFVPSMYLYLALDIFLIFRFALLRRASTSRRWHTLYGFLSLVMALLLGTDLLDCLTFAKMLELRSGTPPDLLWFIPFLAMAATARLRNHGFPAADQPSEETAPPVQRRLWGPLVLYAFAFPILHFGLYTFGLLDSASRPPRELLVLLILLALAAMTLTQQVLLEKRARSLQSDVLRLAAIVESSDDAIISTNLENTITTWNLAATRVYGYSADEVKGRPISLLVCSERSGEMSQIVERVKGGERVDNYEVMHLTKGGARIDVSLTISSIRNSKGRIAGISAIARDVTARKEALLREERHRATQKTLRLLMHQIHDPLAGILGNLSLLKDEDMAASARICLQEISACADKIHSVLRHVRKVDLTDSGQITGS